MNSSGHEYLAHLCALHVPALASFEQPLRHGSTAPDKMFGHRGTRHHALGEKIRRHKSLAGLARLHLLLGDGAGAAFRLGMLLHYIADGAIAVPGANPNHAAYEAAVGRSLRRCSVEQADKVGGARDVLFPEQAAPRVSFFGRYEIPSPPQAAEKALAVSLRTANAVFAPLIHPADLDRARAFNQRRREQEMMLPRLLRFEKGMAWYLPWAGLANILAMIFTSIGLWIARGFWFRPAMKFEHNDAAHLGYYVSCAAFVAGFLAMSPAFPQQQVLLWVSGYLIVFLLWGALCTAVAALSSHARRFWLIAFALLGPLMPLALSLIALVCGRCDHRK